MRVHQGLGQLRLFNSYIVEPPPVAALREALLAADAVAIASTEYAHGVTGEIKNGLDWMVGNESFIGKPVALLKNASPRATRANASLHETIIVMSVSVIEAASITLPLVWGRT